jgi:hypothetical protein
MSFSHPLIRRAAALLVLAAAGAFVIAVVNATPAKAAYYEMLLCAGNVGAGEYTTETNTTSPTNPTGTFTFENHCGPAGDPGGNSAFLRIAENQASGNAALGAFGRLNWSAPEGVQIAAAGGYTREPNSFNEGWRARYWVEGYDGSENNVLVQGAGVTTPTEVNKPKTTTFASHLWPFTALGSYRRFSFEMDCVREAGCDRSNFNAADTNTMLLTLNDPSPPTVAVSPGPLTSGGWVKGVQPLGWATSDAGSGLRYERVRVDGAEQWLADYRSSCDVSSSEVRGEFARSFEPCPRGGPFPHSTTIDTASLADGAHTLTVCAQDFGQASGLDGSGGETCEAKSIRTDNTAPTAPLALAIASADPDRYLSSLTASWSLPADAGSPITKVHYWITDASGNVVVPEQIATALNPTSLPVAAPASAGAYELHVALEDEVGFVGPAATVSLPHDTTPPAAPQDISVTPPNAARSERGFDVQWTNIVDQGAPITAAHYEITDLAGNVVVGEQTVTGEDPQAIEDLATPESPGDYQLRVWLSDAEGNVGAPVSAPLAFDCVRSEVKGAVSVSATFGPKRRNQALVPYGSGATLAGKLRGGGGREVGGAPVCVYSRIVTSHKRRFLGVAVTNPQGEYQFPVPAGASREITVENRPGGRVIRSRATLVTRARPTIELVSKTPVHNKHTAVFRGVLPGPDSGGVAIVLQVKDGNGFAVFRQVTTRPDGSYQVSYPFTQSFTPRTYAMRTMMPRQKGVPYHSGASELIPVPVRP